MISHLLRSVWTTPSPSDCTPNCNSVRASLQSFRFVDDFVSREGGVVPDILLVFFFRLKLLFSTTLPVVDRRESQYIHINIKNVSFEFYGVLNKTNVMWTTINELKTSNLRQYFKSAAPRVRRQRNVRRNRIDETIRLTI